MWETIKTTTEQLLEQMKTLPVSSTNLSTIEEISKIVTTITDELENAKSRLTKIHIYENLIVSGDDITRCAYRIFIDGKKAFSGIEDDDDSEQETDSITIDSDIDINFFSDAELCESVRKVITSTSDSQIALIIDKEIFKHDYDTSEHYTVIMDKQEYLKNFRNSFW